MAVPFTRSSMWKGTIERTTRAAVKDAHQDFIDSAPELQPQLPAARAPHMRVPVRHAPASRRTKSGRLSDSTSGALSGRGMSTRLSRDLVRKQTGSLEGLPSQQERGTSDSAAVADVAGLMQRVEPAFRKDFLRVLRAGLDAEEAVSSPGSAPQLHAACSAGCNSSNCLA